jgi:hypothetical protein
VRAAGFADIEDSADVGMIEGGDDPRLALEPDAESASPEMSGGSNLTATLRSSRVSRAR